MPVHEVASQGFGSAASAYERARPSYPPDAVAWMVDALALAPGGVVADVAAGTGKLTRLLDAPCAEAGCALVAVEPVAGMRALLADGTTVGAVAEALPFRDGALHGVTVAQAFHWFDALVALRELHRVLAPSGRVALVWNTRARDVPWVDALWSIIDRVEKRAPWREHEDWHLEAFADSPWFTPLVGATFSHDHLLSPDDVIERVRSVSHVAALPPAQQEAVLDEVRALLASDPLTAGQDVVAMPYRVDAYWAERRG